MALTGQLEVFNFVDIFQIIRKDKKDGILVVENDEKKFAVYFKEGNIVYIREVKKVFYIYLDIEFEAVLKKEGVKKEDLYRLLVGKLPVLLAVKKGKFSFTPGFIKYSDDIDVYVPLEKIIMFLSRQLTPQEVERKISDEKLVYEKTEEWEEIAEKAYLTEKEKKILESIDGKKTVEQLKNETGIDDLSLRRALYGFLAVGLIKRAKKERRLGFNLTKGLLKKIIGVIKGL